jgi:hypothetical protein
MCSAVAAPHDASQEHQGAAAEDGLPGHEIGGQGRQGGVARVRRGDRQFLRPTRYGSLGTPPSTIVSPYQSREMPAQ